MAIGKRKPKQQGLFVAATEIVKGASHPFYEKVNETLDRNKVDRRLEYLCKRFYAPPMGRPGLAPGTYFRMLLVGFFESIDSERGIAWRVADSLSLRDFLGFSVTEETPCVWQLKLGSSAVLVQVMGPIRTTMPACTAARGLVTARIRPDRTSDA